MAPRPLRAANIRTMAVIRIGIDPNIHSRAVTLAWHRIRIAFGGSRKRRVRWPWVAALIVAAGIAGGAVMWHSQVQAREDRHAAAVRFCQRVGAR